MAGTSNDQRGVTEAYRQVAEAFRRGDLAAVERLGRALIEQHGEHYETLSLLGAVVARAGRTDDAVELLRRAAEASPDNASAHNNLGNALTDAYRTTEALDSYRRAIALRPDYANARLGAGESLLRLGMPERALPELDAAVALRPADPQAQLQRGIALCELGRPSEALGSLDRAVALAPGDPQGHNARGVALRQLRRSAEALAAYGRAIALAPDDAMAHYNVGVSLMDLGRAEEAVASYQRAIALAPALADAHNNLGHAYRKLRRDEEAIRCYEQALALQPSYPFLAGSLWLARRQIADWHGDHERCRAIEQAILRGEPASPPFPVLALSESAAVQRRAAEIWVARKLAPSATRCRDGGARGDRIRIAYFSPDFREHAVSQLLVETIELHDRSRFEITGFSFGPGRDDPMRQRLQRAFDRFIDAHEMTDEAVAAHAGRLGIDVAVDLAGHTDGGRGGVFARRAAPVQVNFLGYPGTVGPGLLDYLIADRTIIPPGSEAHYAEKIVRLPHTYQPNDRQRRIAGRAFTRAEAGLPSGFVYCCFNNTFKIGPDRFETWMRILQQVPGSVLWLLQDRPATTQNLRGEARRLGVDPDRLVFAPRMSPADHLARHRLADLFVDTGPYGAHTTASDALWTGLPVLTCPGESFASRVAASLLRAVDLVELVAPTPRDYEALAVELAADPPRLAAIRSRLEAVRDRAPLFDSPRFTRDLELAFEQMVRRSRAGLAPEHFDVAE